MKIDDVIYGTITLPPEVAAIVQTPLFQRLRKIKQLGFMRLSDNRHKQHSRYYHCIGVYHSACIFLEALERNTPWLWENNNEIPLVYRNAVKIAALLHDIGHGPFSHSWEQAATSYQHENISMICIDVIFASLDRSLFPELRENNNFGIELLKHLIGGQNAAILANVSKRYSFISKIVSSTLDVDKWDYLKRDLHYINQFSNKTANFDDIFLHARVSDCGQNIEFHCADTANVYGLLEMRWQFHVYSYQLPANIICDDILHRIVEDLKQKGEDISAISPLDDMPAFLELYDDKVMRSLESHALTAFINNHRFVRVEDVKTYIGETSEVNKLCVAQRKIKPVEEKDMKKFTFFGSPDERSQYVNRTFEVKEQIEYFCDESNGIVFYCVRQI